MKTRVSDEGFLVFETSGGPRLSSDEYKAILRRTKDWTAYHISWEELEKVLYEGKERRV